MKTYVQYFHIGCISGDLIEACGDRALVRLVGRHIHNNIRVLKQMALDNNGVNRPHYQGFQIIQGDHLLDAKPITEIVDLRNQEHRS